ncbi:MAG: gliding motility lipoprotein GldH [Fulvivirga sp.]
MKLSYLLFVGLLIIQFSCDDKRIFEDYADFEKKYWLADSIQYFNLEIDQPEMSYNLYLNVRNTNTYPYHNLYVKYQVLDSSGNTITENLVNKNLYNAKTGEPKGSGLGDIFSHQFLLEENFTFTKKGSYRLSLQQYMRQDTLKGIVSAGIRLEHSTSSNE